MKVPTYEAQLQRPRQGQALPLTAQLSASAMAAPALAYAGVGQQIATIGAEVAEFAYKKAQIGADSEAASASANVEVELATAEAEALRNPNMSQAEEQYRTQSQLIIDKYNGTMSNRLARGAFATNAVKIQTRGLLSFTKANNKRVVEAAGANLTLITDEYLIMASDLSADSATRSAAVMNGLGDIVAGEGYLGPENIRVRIETFYENLAASTLANYMNRSDADALAIVESFRNGTSGDIVLQAVRENLTPEQIGAIAKEATKQANSIIKLRKHLREQEEDDASNDNDQIYNQIVNVNLDDPLAVTVAREQFEALRGAGYFEKLSESKAVWALLGDTDAKSAFPKQSSATDVVEARLSETESFNNLTFEELHENKWKVTKQFYTQMLQTLELERGEAETDALQDFRTTFKYTEESDRALMGTPSRQAYNASAKALRRYIRESPGASYRQIMEESARLIAGQKTKFEVLFEAYKVGALDSAYTMLPSSLQGKIPKPLTANINDVQEAVSALLAAGNTDAMLLAFNTALNKALDLRIFN